MSNTDTPDGKTKLLALFGAQLEASPSPATHTRWARALHMNTEYLPLATNTEQEFLALTQSLMQSPHFLGANITNPFKTSALKLAGLRIDESARECGAANTLYRISQNQQVGWSLANTDLQGCSESLTKILSEKNTTNEPVLVVLLGAGAMMQTLIHSLEVTARNLRLSFDVRVAARSANVGYLMGRTNTQSSLLRISNLNITDTAWVSGLKTQAGQAQKLLCINSLPSGTSDEAEQVTVQSIRALDHEFQLAKKSLFCVSYGQRTWHQYAHSLGWTVLNGDLLFETQARASFKLWTGCDAPKLPTALPPN